MTWEEFRRRYETEVLPGLAKETGSKVRVVLSIVERTLSPQRLRDVNEARISHLAATIRADGKSETTLQSYLAHLKAMLRWAVGQKLLTDCPTFPKIQRKKKSKGTTPMKGRPITGEEFERMLATVPSVVGEVAAPAWTFYLLGLWFSGLRLRESTELWWDHGGRLHPVFPRHGRPMLRIPAELEKRHSDRLLPMAPEFAAMLAKVPEAERTGPVFKLPGLRATSEEVRSTWVGRIISKIG